MTAPGRWCGAACAAFALAASACATPPLPRSCFGFSLGDKLASAHEALVARGLDEDEIALGSAGPASLRARYYDVSLHRIPDGSGAYAPDLFRLYTLDGRVIGVQRTYRARGDKLRPRCADALSPERMKIEASASRQRPRRWFRSLRQCVSERYGEPERRGEARAAWQDERTTLSLSWDEVDPGVEGWTIRCVDRRLLRRFVSQCRKRAKTPVCKAGESPFSRRSARCTSCSLGGL